MSKKSIIISIFVAIVVIAIIYVIRINVIDNKVVPVQGSVKVSAVTGVDGVGLVRTQLVAVPNMVAGRDVPVDQVAEVHRVAAVGGDVMNVGTEVERQMDSGVQEVMPLTVVGDHVNVG